MHPFLRQLGLYLGLLLISYGRVQAQIDLKTGAPTPGTVCAGSTVSMTYELSGFPAGKHNYYLILAIPNSNGSFASIRTFSVTDTLSPLRVTLPRDLKTNSNYGLSVAISKPGNVTVTSGAKLFAINAIPDSPTVSDVNICQGDPPSSLTATPSPGGSLDWFFDATGGTRYSSITPLTDSPALRTYYVSQTVNGCESSRVPINVTINAKPAPPTVKSPSTYCQYSQAGPLAATGQT